MFYSCIKKNSKGSCKSKVNSGNLRTGAIINPDTKTYHKPGSVLEYLQTLDTFRLILQANPHPTPHTIIGGRRCHKQKNNRTPGVRFGRLGVRFGKSPTAIYRPPVRFGIILPATEKYWLCVRFGNW